jgi:hypothetical protein
VVPELAIREMRREELDTLVEWAADEGWNPGRNDAQIFWDTDPQGFVAAEQGGELIGGGSIVSPMAAASASWDCSSSGRISAANGSASNCGFVAVTS